MITTAQTANQLSDLVTEARRVTGRARRARQTALMHQARSIGVQLDAARTHLIRHPDDAIDAAVAFVQAGTRQLQGITAQLDRLDLGIDRLAAERVDADDVIAWLEWHAIHLYPYQRRAIERHRMA